MNINKSEQLFERASKRLVGGVNSPVRSFKSVGGNPIFIKSGKASKVVDEDDNQYLDMVLSYGPMILGHGNESVLQAVEDAMVNGFSFGSCSKLEVEHAELVCKAIGYDKVRFVNSGTEAVLSAIRLARGITKKNKLIKFQGCYHGHVDALLVEAGSGLATLNIPSSEGVLKQQVADTLIAKYNDIESVEAHFKLHKDIAAIIIEPVAGNMGVVLPEHDFLKKLRTLCTAHGAIMIVDEVMTGFRSKFGLTQDLFEIKADIVCLGKVVGGGFPVGAYAANDYIMQHLSPLGMVYQAGTLSGNPVAMSCGKATLEELRSQNPYDTFFNVTKALKESIISSANKYDIPVEVNHYGSMISLFFTETKVIDFDTAKTVDEERFKTFFWRMMEKGIYLPPSSFEAWFLSSAHKEEHISFLMRSISEVFKTL